MQSKLKNHFIKILLFLPLILNFGKRSYIAYDEGFYALQAKWILQTNNWIIPVWWDEYNLDRTIGIQFLIAKSQQIFGQSSFAAHLPTTIAAALMLLLTYKLHQELISKKEAIISTLILATTYIWLDFAHLATQDMIFACLVTFGIYSLTQLKKENNSIYLFTSGLWIGLAFMMKTFLIAIPLLALLPYIIYKRKTLNNQFFWLGIFIGLLPFGIWSFSINQYIDKHIIFYLIDKFNNLSGNNNFTNPFYYYLWNIPLNFFPWSIFTIIGISYQFRSNKKISYLLIYFPILFIFILSLFSTKTPYYVLPISSILSINAYIGLKKLILNEKLQTLLIQCTTKLIPFFIFCSSFIYFLIGRKSTSLNLKEEFILFSGLTITAIILIFIKETKNYKSILLTLMILPYLIGTSLVQSGLLTDRSRELRETIEYIFTKEDINNTFIKVISPNSADNNSISKLIKISLLTPNLGKGIKELKDLNISEFAWIKDTQNSNFSKKNYEIIASNKTLNPWKLIKRKE